MPNNTSGQPAGASTLLPRWVARPTPDGAREGTYLRDVDPAAATGVRRVARDLDVSWMAIALAAHVRVLATLSGDPTVTTGLRLAGTDRVATRGLAVAAGGWTELVRAAEEAVLGSRDDGDTGEPPDTILDLRDEAIDGPGDAGALCTSVRWDGDSLVVVLGYRTDAVDTDYAARLAGYYVTALACLVAAPEREHAACCLVTVEEREMQRAALCGPRRPLPTRRLHELFEDRARRHPDVVALVHRDRRWTYGELNQRANRLARALVRAGLDAENTVAVVMHRDLYWAASVLAVFKAGGAYLPIEPGYPPQRIARMLERAGCRYVLTGPDSETNFASVRSADAVILPAEIVSAPGHPSDDENLDLPVEPGQLAYVYFTSGSTGEPKGVMCEHAGMVNHVLAKVEDLEITAGSVVAQVASQCFDISLWQLVSALVVGGRTVIVEQDAVPDTARFLDVITRTAVEVLQVVPSYLEALLHHLAQQPRELPALRIVSVTGEAVKVELVARWFAGNPTIRLVNAYGLTETSDDTNHEVMDRPPAGDRVPLGRPVRNADIRLLDAYSMPVPAGAPGEIVFGGLCVGRGYINDPERTAAAFRDDPERPGGRLYYSGDFGRLRPDGRLEFLGRRDHQVKIRGFRVELGEVENALLRVPGVRDAAVVVVGGDEPYLCAFYSSEGGLDEEGVRAELRRSLASYMLPSGYRAVDSLPVTSNGKVDRKALTELAANEPTKRTPPSTPTERWLARVWSEVLQTPPDLIGRHDSFFDLGTSLAAIKLLASLDRRVSLRELTDSPVLADLGRLVDARGGINGHANGNGVAVKVLARPAPPVFPAARTFGGLDVTFAPGRPAVVRAGRAPDWLAEHRTTLDELVEVHGAALVRGLGIDSAAALGTAADALSMCLMSEREGFAGRDRHAEGVYSSAHWPPDQPMCMHHEMSYSQTVPGRLLLACLRPATTGGVTGVADSRAVAASLPAELLDRFAREGWLLRRVFRDYVGVDWRDAFGVADPAAAEAYCRSNDIEAVWDTDGALRTAQRRDAFVEHPVTGELCWFNQIGFLNAATLAPAVREYLEAEFGPEGLPFNSFHGDGEPIAPDVITLINDAYEAATLREPWQAGDLMIVDNIRMAHSREPYEGPREVLMAFANPVAGAR
jgi:amino acid adenylation domain-containing protein